MTDKPLDTLEITQDDIYHQPWKYTGYKKYTWFLDSDDNFLVFRRFGALNARILLALQDDLCVLEERLKELDNKYSLKSAPRIHNGSFRYDQQVDRILIIDEIKETLKEYNQFLSTNSQLRAMASARPENIESVLNWHTTNEGAIDVVERSYLDHTDDLVQIKSRFRTPLRRFLEKTRPGTRFRWLSFLRREPQDKTFYDPGTMYYAKDKLLEHFVTLLVCLVGLVMLVAPLWALKFVTSLNARLGIITGFVVVFLVLIQSVTIAKPFETLAATAAYSAVLMVFMQGGVA
ncbi:hypothetical protein N431DRAFT_421114 [Stipitochalara longipes BDJ]|nr:hypothetical protein N431DRAFT_421114 [Stipitochalara longipes BDJ]